MRLNASPTSAVQSSGSMRSAIDVEPAMSANSTVIERRSLEAVGRAGIASLVLIARQMLVVVRARGRSARNRLLAGEDVERAGDHLEDLRARALAEAIADHVTAARRFDHARIAQHADVLARRGRGAIDDTREIAGRERRLSEGADDLDPRDVGDALDEVAGFPLLPRRDQLLLGDLDSLGIDRRGPSTRVPTAYFIPFHSLPLSHRTARRANALEPTNLRRRASSTEDRARGHAQRRDYDDRGEDPHEQRRLSSDRDPGADRRCDERDESDDRRERGIDLRGGGLTDECRDRGEHADAERRADRDARWDAQQIHERADDRRDRADAHHPAEEPEDDRDAHGERNVEVQIVRAALLR